MYKLLLLDIDGTLRDEYLGIPKSAMDAIHMCQANNMQVVICTGRSIGTIQEDVKALAVDGYLCGGGCYGNHHGNILWNAAFSQAKVQCIMKELQNSHAAYALESQEKVYMNQGAKEIFDHMNQSKRKQKSINKQFIQESIQYEDNIHEFVAQRIHKLCLWSTKDVVQRIQRILQEDMEIAQQDVYEGVPYYEIIQKGFHKGDAVQNLQTYLKITKEETICFGDGENDIEMMKASGCGIAMKSSPIQLQRYATSICEDVWEDGIYLELKRRKII